MPALGHTITPAVVRHALQTMEEPEFRRAYLNQWTSRDDRVIPDVAWRKVRKDVTPERPVFIGVDINPERTFSAIAVVDSHRRAEIGRYGAGTSWVADYVIEMAKRLKAPVALDVSGPAGTLAHDFESHGLTVVKVSGRDLAMACGAFYDAVIDGTIAVRDSSVYQEPLDLAVSAARKRPLGDAWAWARRDTASDICPLVALTVAHWASLTTTPHASSFEVAWL